MTVSNPKNPYRYKTDPSYRTRVDAVARSKENKRKMNYYDEDSFFDNLYIMIIAAPFYILAKIIWILFGKSDKNNSDNISTYEKSFNKSGDENSDITTLLLY